MSTAATNFMKLCKIKYYNFCCFHDVQQDRLIQSGDPTATGKGGMSIYGYVRLQCLVLGIHAACPVYPFDYFLATPHFRKWC